MQFKAGVVLNGITPPMLYALAVVDQAFVDFAGCNAVVTSCVDGKHNPGSKHGSGNAADIRTRGIQLVRVQEIVQVLHNALDKKGFDIVLEGEKATAATTAPHIHIEFDPKPGDKDWRL